MRSARLSACVLFALGSLAWGQGPSPSSNPQEITASVVNFPLLTALPPVTQANIAIVGNPGTGTYYYWLVANYTFGQSRMSYVFQVNGGPTVLSGSNYVSITPTYPSGATSVDLLRTSTNAPPSGTGNYAVSTGQTSGAISDTGAALSSYTVNAADPRSFNLCLTNQVQGAGSSHLILDQGPIGDCSQFVADLSVGGGGGSIHITGSGPISATPSPITGTGVIGMLNSGVTAGTYNYPTFTVNQYGLISSASSNPLYYQTVDANGTALAQEPKINFISGTNSTVTCVDNSGATRTDCTFASSGGGGSVGGSGTGGTLAEWTGSGASTTLGNSPLVDNGVNLLSDTTRTLNVNLNGANLQPAIQAIASPSSGCNGSNGILSVVACETISGNTTTVSGTGVSAGAVFSITEGGATGNPGLIGVRGKAQTDNGTTTTANYIAGVVGYGQENGISGSATVPNVYGVYGVAENVEGTVTQMAGLTGSILVDGSEQATTTTIGVHVLSPTISALDSNHYGILIEDQTAGGGTNNPNPHGIVELGTAPNSLGGSLTVAGLSGCLQATVGLISGTGSSCSSGGIPYPSGSGVPQVVSGTSWGTTLGVGTAANNLVQLTSGAQLPAVNSALTFNSLLIEGLPSTVNASGVASSSPSRVLCDQFTAGLSPGSDYGAALAACVNYAITNNLSTADGTGLPQKFSCATPPIPLNSGWSGTLLLPMAQIFDYSSTNACQLAMANHVHVVGQGWTGGATYTAGEGTTIVACGPLTSGYPTTTGTGDYALYCHGTSKVFQAATGDNHGDYVPLACFTNSATGCASGNTAAQTSSGTGFNTTIEKVGFDLGGLANAYGFANYYMQEGSYAEHLRFANWCGSNAVAIDIGAGYGGAENWYLHDMQFSLGASCTVSATAVPIRIDTVNGSNGNPSYLDRVSVVNNYTGTRPNHFIEYRSGAPGAGMEITNSHAESFAVCFICEGVTTISGTVTGGTANGLITDNLDTGPNTAGALVRLFNNSSVSGATVTRSHNRDLRQTGSSPINLVADDNNTAIPTTVDGLSEYTTSATGTVLIDTSQTNPNELLPYYALGVAPASVTNTLCYSPNGTTPGAITNCLPGVNGRAQTNATGTGIVATDCSTRIEYQGYTGAGTDTVPLASSLAVPLCSFKLAVPTTLASGAANGVTQVVISAGAGATVNGGSSVTLLVGQSKTFFVDPTNATNWEVDSGSGSSLSVNSATVNSPNLQNGSQIDFTATGSNIVAAINAASVTNADLVNASMTVGGQTCTLGGSCTPNAPTSIPWNNITTQTANATFSSNGYNTNIIYSQDSNTTPDWLVQDDSGGTGGYPIFAVYNTNAAAMTGPVLQVSDASASRTGTSYGIISAENAFSGTQPFYEAHNGANILFSLAQNSSSSPTAINLNLGKAGLAIGGINFYNTSTGSVSLKPIAATALGTIALVLPDVSGTLTDIVSPTGGKCLQSFGTAGLIVELSGGCATSVFPLTVSGTVTSGGVPYFNSTIQESSSALLAANAIMQGGGAGAAPTTGNADFTVDSPAHTLKAGAAGLVDLSAETGSNAFKMPAQAGETSTANGANAFDTTNSQEHNHNGGVDSIVAAIPASTSVTNTDCASWSKSGSTLSLNDSGSPCYPTGTNAGLNGTTGSIGGSLLAAGACASGTATVTGAVTTNAVSVSPNTYPGAGITWNAQVTATNTVTVYVCAAVSATPTASTYNVSVGVTNAPVLLLTGGGSLSASATDYLGAAQLCTSVVGCALLLPRNTTISSLYCHYTAAVTGSQTITVTAQHGVSNSVSATSLSCVINSTNSTYCSDTNASHAFTTSTSTQDTIQLQSVPSGTPTAASMNCSVIAQ